MKLPKAALKDHEMSLAEKGVNLAINMSDVCVRICSDAIRDNNPRIKEEELLELVRERITYGRRRVRGV